jgi:PAS domain S-box-containing protein
MPDAGARLHSTSDAHRLKQQFFNAIFDLSPYGIGICDSDLRIVVVNPAWAAMDGVAVEEHVGKTVPEVLGVDACPVEVKMKEVLATGESLFKLKFAAKIPARPEGTLWVVNLMPLRNEAGEVTHVASLTFDSGSKMPYLMPIADELLSASSSVRSAHARLLERLSKREKQVALLLVRGKSNKEVASLLGGSPRTVETHRAHIFKKLGIHTVVELVHLIASLQSVNSVDSNLNYNKQRTQSTGLDKSISTL